MVQLYKFDNKDSPPQLCGVELLLMTRWLREKMSPFWIRTEKGKEKDRYHKVHPTRSP
jgi:hypothetical protein